LSALCDATAEEVAIALDYETLIGPERHAAFGTQWTEEGRAVGNRVCVARKLTREEKNCEGAIKARRSEAEKIAVKYACFARPVEANSIKAGTYSDTAMLSYLKGAEMPGGHPERKFKGRFVVLGDKVRQIKGGGGRIEQYSKEAAREGGDYCCPVTSLRGARALLASAMLRDLSLWSVGIEAASLQCE